MNAEHADLEARVAAPAKRDLPPGRHNQHREILMNHMLTASRQAEPAPARHPRHPRRRILAISGTAGIVVAAAAAVALVVTSAPASSHNAAASGKPPAKTTQAAANPVLAQLAADITARQPRLTGNATLEIRNQSPAKDKPGDYGVDLYTDDGTYYAAPSESALPGVIAQHQDMGEGEFKRAIAAALIAVKGDIATAAARMTVANYIPGAKPTPAAKGALIEKIKAVDKAQGIKYVPPKPLTPEQQKEQADSFTWMNSLDALTAAPENAQVRAGVLAIMATMPDVTVTHTTTAGQPTLTLADTWPNFSGSLVESLVINASTGFPVAIFNSGPGQPLNVTYYHARRVTLADIEAGKF